MQVGLHEFEHEVDVLIVLRAEDVKKPYDVFMGELTQEHYLAISALGVRCVLEGVKDLLKGEGLACLAVGDLPYVSVGSATHLLYDFVATEYVLFNFLGHPITN